MEFCDLTVYLIIDSPVEHKPTYTLQVNLASAAISFHSDLQKRWKFVDNL